MDETTKKFFKALERDRNESSVLLSKASMKGIWNSVVEKYSELAHFILELLQNADDAGATKARFVLSDKELIFAHNGTRHFSVSDPAHEEEDTKAGCLGDVNAITSIANSNKSESSIGKFGVGFKAVFQYTDTPHIYGPEICFKIENFIVPRMLEKDHPDRKDDETLFVFPFNKSGMPRKVAVRDISQRLRTLDLPTLFLNNLTEIHFKSSSCTCSYTKEIISTFKVGDIKATLLSFMNTENDKQHKEDLWMMSRMAEDDLTCSVCFFVDENGLLKPVKRNAYCFFPTQVNTGLKFVVHAPFLLTDSREGIKLSEEHNIEMVNRLADLSSSSLPILRDIGTKTKKPILGDTFFNVLPYEEEQHPEASRFSFEPIRKAIQEKLKKENLLPAETGFSKPGAAYIPETKEIADLFPQDKIRQFVGQKSKKHILPSLTFQELHPVLKQFLRGLGVTVIDENFILTHIDAPFITPQNSSWLSDLHLFLSENQTRIIQAKTLPVFLDVDGVACSAFAEDGSETLFLGAQDTKDCKIINPELLSHPGTSKLVAIMGLKEPTLQPRVLNIILPSFANGRSPRDTEAFLEIFKCYEMSLGPDKKKFIEQASNCGFLLCLPIKGRKKKSTQGVCPKEAYYPNDDLREYFGPINGIKFVDVKFYQRIIEDHAKLDQFLMDLGVSDVPRLYKREVDPFDDEDLKRRKWAPCAEGRPESWEETGMDGYDEALEYILNNHDKKYSQILWNTMVAFIRKNSKSDDLNKLFAGTHHYFMRGKREENYSPTTILHMRRKPWLVDRNDKFVSPKKTRSLHLDSGYDLSSKEGRMLARYVELIEPSDRELWADELDKIAMRNCGVSLESFLKDPKNIRSFEEFLRNHRSRKPDLSFAKKGDSSKGPNRTKPKRSDEKHPNDDDDDDDDDKPDTAGTATASAPVKRAHLHIQRADGTIPGKVEKKPSDESKDDQQPKTGSVSNIPPSSKQENEGFSNKIVEFHPSGTTTTTATTTTTTNTTTTTASNKSTPKTTTSSAEIPPEPALIMTAVFPRPTTLLTKLRKELIDPFNKSPFPKATYIISVVLPKQKVILDEMVILEKIIDVSENIPPPLLSNPENVAGLILILRTSLQQITEGGGNVHFQVDVIKLKEVYKQALTFYSQKENQ